MATISKTPAGTFKAVIRSNGRIIKTKTFKLKKHAREWAKRIEGDKGVNRNSIAANKIRQPQKWAAGYEYDVYRA